MHIYLSTNLLKIMYYVIQVKTGKEEKTIEAIKRRLGKKQGFELFSPYRKDLRKYKGEFKEVKVRCFPGYIFVETDKPYELFVDLWWVDEFTKMLGREGYSHNFEPLTDDESRMVDILYNKNADRTTEISNIVVKEGQIVRVLDGPLDGLLAKVKRVDLHKRYVTVIYTICGVAVESKLAINIITDVINK